MDKDRIAGAAKEIKGTLKDATGRIIGNEKLQAEGKADKAAGKVQNAMGTVKDDLIAAIKKSARESCYGRQEGHPRRQDAIQEHR